jgi:hypothetical protein
MESEPQFSLKVVLYVANGVTIRNPFRPKKSFCSTTGFAKVAASAFFFAMQISYRMKSTIF